SWSVPEAVDRLNLYAAPLEPLSMLQRSEVAAPWRASHPSSSSCSVVSTTRLTTTSRSSPASMTGSWFVGPGHPATNRTAIAGETMVTRRGRRWLSAVGVLWRIDCHGGQRRLSSRQSDELSILLTEFWFCRTVNLLIDVQLLFKCAFLCLKG